MYCVYLFGIFGVLIVVTSLSGRVKALLQYYGRPLPMATAFSRPGGTSGALPYFLPKPAARLLSGASRPGYGSLVRYSESE
jgi:hypothetical protein